MINSKTQEMANSHNSTSKPKRPFVVTVLLLMVLSYTVLGWFGFLAALRNWDFLQSLPLSVPPLYLALRNIVWGAVGVPLIWGLWIGRRWAWYATQAVAGLYAVYYWLDRAFLADPTVSPLGTGRWPFVLGLTAICLIYTLIVLRLPLSRRFFEV